MSFIENVRGTVEHLPLPGGNHGGMDTKSTGYLSGCFVVLNRRERDLRFELWTVHFSLFTHLQILL
jgi:hypothetical protein